MDKQPIPNVAGMVGDIIKPYLSADGKSFEKDFYMVDRMAAMKGASVEDYEQNLIRTGLVGRGIKPLHFYVVGPDHSDLLPNEVMTSPGTPEEYGGPGWIAAGARYQYDGWYGEQINAAAWLKAGAPKENVYGRWNGYLPQDYVDDSWRRGLNRDRRRLRDYGPGR